MNREQEQRPPGLNLEQVVDLAREVLLRDGEHVPTLIAEGSRRLVLLPLPVLGESHEQRLVQMFTAGFVLGHGCDLGRLRQVFFICEGWMSRGVGGMPPHIPPSQDPARREVLMISTMEFQERKSSWVLFEMLRDRRGKLVEVHALDEAAGMEAQSDVQSPLLDAFAAGFDAGVE